MSTQSMTLLDGEVVLFFHTGDTYYCRFKNRYGGSRYIRKSLKTKSYELAVVRARELFLKHVALVKEGVNPREMTWDVAVARYLPMLDKSSVSYSLSRSNELYFSKYFSRFTSVREIGTDDVDEYFRWRCDYWKKRPAESKSGLIYFAEVPAPETLVKERRYINLIFKKLRAENLVRQSPLMPRMDRLRAISEQAGRSHTESKYRRPAMSEQTYEKWKVALINKLVESRKWKKGTKQINCLRLYLWVEIIASTGIRPQELRHVRHSDLSFMVNNKGEVILVVEVRPEISKTKKWRKAPSVVSHNALKENLEWWVDLHSDVFGHEMQPNGLVFPKKRNRTDPESYWGEPVDMAASVKRSLRNLGLYEQEGRGGRRVTLSSYSLRGMWITERIKEGIAPVIIAKAAGTSVEMIERFYDGSDATDFLEFLIQDTKRRDQGVVWRPIDKNPR